MAKPRVFVSSTYLDLVDLRDSLAAFFENLGFEAKLFERGGVYYDPNEPLDESCLKEVGKSDLFVLIIGGRYGSPTSAEAARATNYNSITKAEYQHARSEGIPVLTFVRAQVNSEFATYRKNPRETRDLISYAHVDNILIFKLLQDIYHLKRGNPVFTYNTFSDIERVTQNQLAGMWQDYLQEKRRLTTSSSKVRINAYKLFFFRTQSNLSFTELSKKSGVDRNVLRRLERINRSKENLDPAMFQRCDKEVMRCLEKTLDCVDRLQVGKPDDFQSIYIQYYASYKGKKKSPARPALLERNLFPVKAVVFDFDGTLSFKQGNFTTWEAVWIALGYDVNECAFYHRQFSEGKISHKEWCDLTLERFRERNLTEDTLLSVAKDIRLIPGTAETISSLRERGIGLYVVSGSIRQIIKHVLGGLYDLFDEVKANDLVFNQKGHLLRIRGTEYDFEGKARFLKELIKANDYSPLEVLFVGNSCNDIWASQSGAVTLCVNPRFTDPNIVEHWSYCIREMRNLREIMDWVKTEDDFSS